jgi:hypothetical protein
MGARHHAYRDALAAGHTTSHAQLTRIDNTGKMNSPFNFGNLGYYFRNNKFRIKYAIVVFYELFISKKAIKRNWKKALK